MVKVVFLGPFGNLMPEEDENGFWNVEADGQTIEQLILSTKVKDSKMGYSLLVNDIKQSKEYVLKDGDTLSVLPLFYAG